MTSKSDINKGDVYRLPNKVIFARDESAEHINVAKRRLNKLMESYFKVDESTRLQMLSLSITDISDALRLLEGIGAQTRP